MEMTVLEALQHAGIKNVEQIGGLTWEGKTYKGNKFRMERACGAYGLQFTLRIDNGYECKHCLFRTAVKKIKTN